MIQIVNPSNPNEEPTWDSLSPAPSGKNRFVDLARIRRAGIGRGHLSRHQPARAVQPRLDYFQQRRRASSQPDATNYFNSAFLVTPAGRLADVYHKRKLVIFGEYIPLVHWLPFVKYLTPITGSFTPGDQPVTFELGDLHVNAAPLICFEDTFPGARARLGEG